VGKKSRKFRKPDKARAPYGWTRLPRVIVLCFVPTYVVGLAVFVLPTRYVRPLDLPATALMVLGVCLSTVVVNRRSDWSDAVIAVLVCVMIGAVAVTLLRIA
jgi:divalent metal cation (Fe/Co/Zn/Cd) transporter